MVEPRFIMLRKLLLSLGICLSLTACETLSSGGVAGGDDKYSTTALAQNLKIGVTTPAEVRALYGKPQSTSDGPNGPGMWVYNADRNTNTLIDQAMSFVPLYGANTAADQMKKERVLHVHFDNNRVSSYSLSDYAPR
jgi:hypothetical protein